MSNSYQDHFLHKENIEDVFDQLSTALRIGVDFKAKDQFIEHVPLNELKNMIFSDLPREGMSYNALLNEFENKIAKYSVNMGSKNFMGFPAAANAISAIAASLLINLLNQNLLNSARSSPAATMVEINVIQWLRELIGYTISPDITDTFDVGGTMIPGGTSANTISLLAAREKAFPGTLEKGIEFDPKKVSLIVPQSIGHYSVGASLAWIGLGENNVVPVPTINYRYDLKALNETIEKEKKRGQTVLGVVAYAGDTRSMTIDNLYEVSKITQKHNIWFHVDACHGVQFAFSGKLKHKIKGLECADSITFDPHKVLFLPYHASVVLFKNPQDFKLVTTKSELILNEDYCLGKITPFMGTKAFYALKLWFLLKSFGTQRIGELVERRHHFAVELANMLSNDSRFVVLNEVGINSVMFLYRPEHWNKDHHGLDKLNEINGLIREELFEEGKFYLHHFPIPDLTQKLSTTNEVLRPLRFMSGNPLIDSSDLKRLRDTIVAKGKVIAERVLSAHE